MWFRWAVIAPITIVSAVGFAMVAQNKIDAMRDETLDEELLYLPNERLLNNFTAGMSSVIADLIWLRTIHYTVKEFHNVNRKFTWLEYMCNTVTQLDPAFTDAYVYGGMLLAAIAADDKAIPLLQRGMVQNPYSWEVPFEIAKVYLLNRREQPESPIMAAYYLQAVAERSENPQFYIDWIERLHDKHDLNQDARTIWELVIANNEDEFIIEIAREKLLELDIHENIAALTQAIEVYEAQFGKKPARIDDLVEEGLISPTPTDEKHGTYFMDRAGKVQNTVLLDDAVERFGALLSADIERFKQTHGRFPESLKEWAEWREQGVPTHPYEDRQWRYSPETGKLTG